MGFGLMLELSREKRLVREDNSLLVHWLLAIPLTALALYTMLVSIYLKDSISLEAQSCLNFQSLEVVSRYRDPQLQVTENYNL